MPSGFRSVLLVGSRSPAAAANANFSQAVAKAALPWGTRGRRRWENRQRGGASTAPSFGTGSLGRGRPQFNGGWCRHQPPLSERDHLAWVQQGIAAQALGGRRGRIPPASHPVCSTFVRGLRHCRGPKEEGPLCFAEAPRGNRLPQYPACAIRCFPCGIQRLTPAWLKPSDPLPDQPFRPWTGRSHANPSRAKRNPPVDK
jgi:hypothetical protein